MRRGQFPLARPWLAAALMLGMGVCGAPASWAVEPDEMLDDPVLEDRARDISAGLRCVVCQNESIDESNAEMARDMRILVRDRLLEGDSNAEVRQYLVDRYGDFVLLKPPFKPATWLLWLSPVLILAGGAAAAWTFYHRRDAEAPAVPAPLSDAEQARLRALLTESESAGGTDRADPGGRA